MMENKIAVVLLGMLIAGTATALFSVLFLQAWLPGTIVAMVVTGVLLCVQFNREANQ